jgi:hypothetical protein
MTELDQLTSVIPVKWHSLVLFALAVSPYLTRAYHAITSGGGLKGVFAAIWLGTNTPKPPCTEDPTKSTTTPTNP